VTDVRFCTDEASSGLKADLKKRTQFGRAAERVATMLLETEALLNPDLCDDIEPPDEDSTMRKASPGLVTT